ncbi:MAG: hypothetical protein AAGI67_15835, partial [Pseudomonadota bacterium]
MKIRTLAIATAAATGLLLTGLNVNTALHAHLSPVTVGKADATTPESSALDIQPVEHSVDPSSTAQSAQHAIVQTVPAASDRVTATPLPLELASVDTPRDEDALEREPNKSLVPEAEAKMTPELATLARAGSADLV